MIETFLMSPTFVTFLIASVILAITPGPGVVPWGEGESWGRAV